MANFREPWVQAQRGCPTGDNTTWAMPLDNLQRMNVSEKPGAPHSAHTHPLPAIIAPQFNHFRYCPSAIRIQRRAYSKQLEPAQADRCCLVESAPVARRASRPGDIGRGTGHGENRDSLVIQAPRERREVTARKKERADCRLIRK